ncbi:MAG: FAD-dependent oxidoreductase, partial [Janthinobacterium lividum]
GLAQRGASVLVLERRREPFTASRAAAVHAGTLRALDRLGVAADLVRSGSLLPRFEVRDPRHTIFTVDFTTLGGRWAHALAVPQWRTEEMLRARVEQLGVEVATGEEVRGVTPARGGALVRTTVREVRARLVVGADGVSSTVRAAVGISRHGRVRADGYLLADVRFADPGPATPGPLAVVLHVARAGALVQAPLPDGLTRLIAPFDPAPALVDTQFLQRVLSQRAPAVKREVREVVWTSEYRVSRLLADRFCVGPVVLLGDAAHVHSPSGGQGMNLGLRDAVSLVEPALRFLARGEPLTGWATRRRGNAARVLRFTRALTLLETSRSSTRCVLDEMVALGSHSAAVRHGIAHRLAGLDDPDQRE